MSLLTPEIPRSPLSLFKRALTCPASMDSFCIRNVTRAGSISPDRVPIKRPSRGVKPMDVSTLLPFETAAALHPLPRCTVMMFISERGLSRISAVLPATYL